MWSLGADAERARRSPRDRLRPDRHEPHLIGNDGGLYETYDGMKTWRHFTNLPLSQFYRVSTDNAQAVLQRLRRHAGQRLDLRAVAHAQRPRRHPHERLVCRRRRRRVLHRQRPRRSEHRLRRVAGGELQPPGPAHGRARQHAPAADAVARAARGRLRAGAFGGLRAGRLRPAAGQPAARSAAAGAGQGAPAVAAAAAAAPADAGTGTRRSSSARTAARRIYVAGERVYRSDDRGDNWAAISPDLTRNLDPAEIPIMGKVWPRDSVAFNQATTQLSTITALDESPLLADLIYVGTFDGLVQVTEDGGKNWRKVEKLPGLPEYTAVTDVVRLDARREHRLRDVQQLSARRLQAVRLQEHRPRPHVDLDCRQPAAAFRRLGDRAGSRQRRPAVCRAWSSACGSPSTAARNGRSSKAAFRRRRRAICRFSGARTIWSSARSAAAPTSSTTTRRCAA